MIARPSLRRAVLAAALAAVVAPAAAPFAGTGGWATPARAADPAAASLPPTVIRHGPRTDRVVALTFDDGWNPVSLRRIFRVLVRERVPATFFVTGIYVQRAPALWRQIAAAGFPLANHSYLHRDTRDLTPTVEAKDLALTREAVEKATGRAMLPYYRPPYGARNRGTDRLAAAAGFPFIVLWDTTGADTEPRPTVSSVVRDASAGRSGSIVLLHAGPRVTPRALPRIIARYRARGFRFVTLPEMLGAPRTDASPAATPAAFSRSLDRPGRDARPAPAGGSVRVTTAGGHAVATREGGEAPPPAQPIPSADPLPPARDAAWARRDETLPALAAWTTGGLLALLVVAAAAGRRAGRENDSPG